MSFVNAEEDISAGIGAPAHPIYSTGCGRKSSHGYLLFLGLALAKTFFWGLYMGTEP